MTAEHDEGTAQPLVLGTAGHIDHGKTALIRALTGVETDRLPEEKARGITIDLGFAALELPGGRKLAVVDVPGHEGLVRTMVSGATGIDLVLLVVAADEGVMPQTREHVSICDLLGIERGLVALTKTDVADEEFVELASEEVRELLAGTGLADAAIVPVSSQTGDGIDRLKSAIAELVEKAGPRTARMGPPRLPIDRAFAMRGFGTVVTGTLVGDALAVGDAIELLPSNIKTRIRGLQSHGQEAKRVLPGSRCAVNLQGVEVSQLSRGDVVTRPNTLRPSTSADVRLRWLEGAPAAEDNVAVEFLTGTAERRAHLAPIATRSFVPGQHLFARLHIDGDAVALLPGDRFIVRGFARSENAGATLGGGVVLDVAPPHRRRSDPALARELEILASGDIPAALAERVLRAGFAGVDARELERETGIGSKALGETLAGLVDAGRIQGAGPRRFIDVTWLDRMEARLMEVLDAFHAAEPMRPGMPRAALRGQLPDNVPAEVSGLALERLDAAKRLQSEGDVVRSCDHRPTLDAEAAAAVARITHEASEAGLEPPGPRDWAESLGIGLDRFRDLVAHLEREQVLVRAPGDLWFDRAAIDSLVARVCDHLDRHGELDTQSYKTLIGTSRRTAMPLMELLDELHITRRQGDVRIRRKGGAKS